ncbi:MAG: LutB/LldF family L-lactate oxidation iron-sulfur protein [Candidatus Promineifilaceae bacterium]|nr:LutB/LldF family L-lactate oxidation iron-sulfur protein [Candidatus Promineifilaceae bacterium]
MKVQSNQFVNLADIAIADPSLQQAVSKGTQNAVSKRMAAMFEVSEDHGEALRQQAAAIKRATLNHLPDLLEEAETRMQQNGVKVLWAENAAEARRHVLDIARQHHVTRVAKSKSMVTEEIGLNDVLEQAGVITIETDLGEYILQLNQEAPSHIVAPVIHKTKASIEQIFVEQIGMPATQDAAEMVQYVRERLREDFLTAEMGVSGGNFIIAESGTVCLVANEGNARMVTSLPPVHVAVVGIEKIVATLEDYVTLTQVLPRSATGQKLTVYTQMINGPRRDHELDGPQHMYVVLVDNGRSDIYAGDYAEALACIRCGACLNICPVYQTTGGHSYGWVYPGPIGSIVTPLLSGLENATPLPFASSLCGACKQACPVDIDIPRMLLDLRHDLVENGKTEGIWDLGLKTWTHAMSSPSRFELGAKVASLGARLYPFDNIPGPLRGWTRHRGIPPFASQSFRTWWKNRQPETDNTRE